jgi:hypothetical protein
MTIGMDFELVNPTEWMIYLTTLSSFEMTWFVRITLI